MSISKANYCLGTFYICLIVTGFAYAQVYVSRNDAVDNLLRDIQEEGFTITFMGVGGWIARESPVLPSLVHAASSKPALRMRFMFPDPDTMETRASQELRAPGQLKLEIQHSISLIRQRLPSAELRLVGVLPVYSAFCLSHTVLYLPYLHTRGPLAAPAFIYRRAAPVTRLYEMIADDLERLWSQARTIETP